MKHSQTRRGLKLLIASRLAAYLISGRLQRACTGARRSLGISSFPYINSCSTIHHKSSPGTRKRCILLGFPHSKAAVGLSGNQAYQ